MPIQGEPLLGIWLRLLERHGITDVLVNLHHFPDQVQRFLVSHPTGIRVQTVAETRLLGSAGTVAENRQFVHGEEAFLIAYADNLTTADLGAMIAFHRSRNEPLTMGVVPTDKPREKGTVVLGPGGQVLAFEEKAANPRSHLANAGIYVASQRLFDAMPAAALTTPLDFGHHVFPRLVPDLAAFPIQEFLMDVGTPADYQRAQLTWPGLA